MKVLRGFLFLLPPAIPGSRRIRINYKTGRFTWRSRTVQKLISIAVLFPNKSYYLCSRFSIRIAVIAQSVERFTRNEKVPGSIPGYGSKVTSSLPSSASRNLRPSDSFLNCNTLLLLFHLTPQKQGTTTHWFYRKRRRNQKRLSRTHRKLQRN